MLWGEAKRHPIDPRDEDVKRTFKRGQCHSLAFALHKLTGWEIALMGEYEDDYWGHAVVVHPDGGYVDIDGRWDADPDVTRWVYEVFRGDPTEVFEYIEGSCDELNSYAAEPFAKEVLRMLEAGEDFWYTDDEDRPLVLATH